MGPNDGGLDALLERSTRLTGRVLAVSPIPTRAWCIEAAGSIAASFEKSVACLVVCRVTPAGRVVDIELTGRAGECSLPQATEPTATRVLADRLGRLSSVGFDIAQASQSLAPDQRHASIIAGFIGQLPEARAWRTTSIGRLVSGVTEHEPIVGIAPIADRSERADSTRCIVALIIPIDAPADPAGTSLLAAVLPLLADRCSLALGDRPLRHGEWLTLKEREVLDLLARGLSIPEIADHLGRSPHTVHDYVKSMHRKLHASTRGELVARALGHAHPRPKPLNEPKLPTRHTPLEAQPSGHEPPIDIRSLSKHRTSGTVEPKLRAPRKAEDSGVIEPTVTPVQSHPEQISASTDRD